MQRSYNSFDSKPLSHTKTVHCSGQYSGDRHQNGTPTLPQNPVKNTAKAIACEYNASDLSPGIFKQSNLSPRLKSEDLTTDTFKDGVMTNSSHLTKFKENKLPPKTKTNYVSLPNTSKWAQFIEASDEVSEEDDLEDDRMFTSAILLPPAYTNSAHLENSITSSAPGDLPQPNFNIGGDQLDDIINF